MPPISDLPRRAALLLLATLLAACVNDVRGPMAPGGAATPRIGTALTCSVQVQSASLACVATGATGPAGSMSVRILGGQDSYVKLASSGTAYDAATGTLTSDVTVQNLVQSALGTSDGTTVSGVMVFLNDGPTVITGNAASTVSLDVDGTGTFLTTGQPYLLYNERLEPYQLSQPRTWTFHVPSDVASFTFDVYVAADMENPAAPLLDAVWTGATDTTWSDTLNWLGHVLPSDTAVVAIPSDSLLASHVHPALDASRSVRGIRVGHGSTLNLRGFDLSASGDVDAVGAITNGTVTLTGAKALVGGTLNAVRVTGAATLQRPTFATGAVAVSTSGSLTVKSHPLTITLP